MPERSRRAAARRRFLRAGAGTLAAAPLLDRAAFAEVIGSDGAAPGGTVLPDRAVGRPFPVGLSLDGAVPGRAPTDEARTVGIAVVGIGDFSIRQMLPAIGRSRRARLAGLVSGNPDKARRVADAYGLPADAVRGYENFDSIADDERVDAVYVVLPNALHAEFTERAFAAGKHVLCEKPMATSVAECERMIRARDEAGKVLMIAYRAHFEPYNLNAIARIADGEIGKLLTIVSNHHRPLDLSHPRDVWRADLSLSGGGPLPDIGIYGLNACCYLTGETPVEVFSSLDKPENDPKFREIERQVVTQLRFPSGAFANLATSYGANVKKLEALGDAGRLEMEPATAYEGNALKITDRDGQVRSIEAGDSTAQFTGEIDGFASAVLDGAEVRTPAEMGLRDMRLIEAIYASARERRPLSLAPDGSVRGG